MHDVEIIDNTSQVITETDEAIERALEIIGGKMSGFAERLCPVDTGLLRNSITYALDGGKFSVQKYKADKPKGKADVKEGAYDKEMPKEPDGIRSVTVGTNVEYAPYVELGAKGRVPKPFIKPSLENHLSDYEKVLRSELLKVSKK